MNNVQKMHNALGAALRSASARGRELIEKMGNENIRLSPQLESELRDWCIKMAEAEGDSEIGSGILAAYPDFGSVLLSSRATDFASQGYIRQNLRDSYPIWVKE